ncbi:MAG TPA: DUF4244 domain-containing protein [Arthrobacter sp.]|nr:DUF4244 domain-containing protein [Arthrobacter sp.]
MSINYYRRNYSARTSAVAAPGQTPTGRTGNHGRTSGTPYAQATAVVAAASVPGTFAPQVPATGLPSAAATVARPGNVVELYPEAGNSTGTRTRPGAGAGVVADRARRSVRQMGSEAGMATAEYAIATLAAVGFAGLLVFILRSDEVRGFLLNLIRTALALP